MHEIKGQDRCVQDLFSSGSYGIDYYQREYKWRPKQLQELVEDLTGRFLESYQDGDQASAVQSYGHYFLGSIVVSQSGEKKHIIDGQQRLTSLTLLLIFINNLQKLGEKRVNLDQLIYSDDFGEKRFKLDVPERNACMEALFNETAVSVDGASESVQNLAGRYQDLSEIFPDEVRGEALPLFAYWLMRKVKLIEIIAYADEDAYTIFETMNDRGLSLSPTDMLKGYLLANIDNPDKRAAADREIRSQLARLAEFGEGTESDFFKSWLRSQYARKIRERRKDARPEDFDLIGTEYHRWVRTNASHIGLEKSDDYYRFVVEELKFYADIYVTLLRAAERRTPGLEAVRYNADTGFTLQHQITLAAARREDGREASLDRVGLVAEFLDAWLNLRLWNYKSNSYSSMQYAAFNLIRSIRNKKTEELGQVLHDKLKEEMLEINFSQPVRFMQFTSQAVHRQLARFTDWLEVQSGLQGGYERYLTRSGKGAFEVEHIWPNHYERYAKEFPQQQDWKEHRNLIGGLVLLPKKVNASLSDEDYGVKRSHYLRENPLAQSLHEGFYDRNPGFKQAMARHDLPFRPMQEFGKSELEERSSLYCQIAQTIWSPDRLLERAMRRAGVSEAVA
jgi:hypothetical protein